MSLIDGWPDDEAHQASSSVRHGLSAYDRRQLLHLDGIRSGHSDAAQRLVGDDLWRVSWATSSDLDPRLHLMRHVGPVAVSAFGVLNGRPTVAAAAQDVGLWDLVTGTRTVIPAVDTRCLSFVTTADEPLIVTGHPSGSLHIWDCAAASLRTAVQTGDSITDLRVVDSGHGPDVVTLHAHGHIGRWSVRLGQAAEPLEVPRSYAICSGQLSDGRQVLATGGVGLSLWSLDDGRRLPLPMKHELQEVAGVVLSKVEGRDCLTVLMATKEILTFDIESGELAGPPLREHENRTPEGMMRVWAPVGRRPKLAAIMGTIAVPTRWRVHLWSLATSEREGPPLAGPVAQSLVEVARWQGRQYLLTGSNEDCVVALWDLGIAATPTAGHNEQVTQIALAGSPQTVISADRGGTIVARDSANGDLVSAPMPTGIETVNALAAWTEGAEVIVAVGAGSEHVPDHRIRRWNATTGRRLEQTIQADRPSVRQLAFMRLADEVLVTFGTKARLRILRAIDGSPTAEIQTGMYTRVSGFAAGLVQGRPAVAISAYREQATVYFLDDLTPASIVIAQAGADFVVDLVDTHVVTGSPDAQENWRVVRAWDLSGEPVGPDIQRDAAITAVAMSEWPKAFIATADNLVSLTNLETGIEVCQAMRLPRTAHAFAVTAGGDLIVGFGSDVARVRPPTS
jgi:WD40 repeat protein